MRIQYLKLFLLILFFSCSGKKNNQEGKTVFRYNEPKGITSLDPAFTRTMANIWAVNQLFNGLVQMDDETRIQPCIAKSWEISNDGLVYTFHLRNDVYFHDSEVFLDGKGRRVAASDFVYSFNRIVDEKVLSPGRWIFNNVETFSAPDDSIFNIHLKKQFPPFLGMLTMQYCSVVPKEAVEHYGKDFGRNPVGTGPFKMKWWYEGVKLVLHKNENYFEIENGQRLPYLDAVSITFINDPQSSFLEFVKGTTDMLSGLDDGSYKDAIITPSGELKEEFRDKVNLLSQPFLNTEYLGFVVNDSLELVKNSPLRKKEIRQAINYGIDRVKMMRYIRNNIGAPAVNGFVPEGLPSFTKQLKGYDYNPTLARELLEKAGYPNGKGLPEITLHTTSQYLDLCEYIQHQLSEIGIKIKMEVNPPGTHGEMVANAQSLFWRKSWIADYADAENYLALFYSKNFTPKGPNYTLFKNEKYDELYEAALKEVNDSVRYETYREMDRIIIENAPVVPLYYDRVLRFVNKNVEGLGSNSMNLLTLKKVKKTASK
ncbi:MAG: Glutathione-binding protein GsiB [Bacteroidia bacterium]|nr:Glutathione-binding protein GsiB [Bacteroidia bacterium]